MMEISELDAAYVAGFIDGEGCFYLGYRKAGSRNCFPCTITLSQTQREILIFLQSIFGGKVYPVESSGKGSQSVWTWSIYGDDADRMVRAILPMLRVKRKQALIYLRMRRLINANSMGKKITRKELIIRIGLVKRISILKGKVRHELR